MILKVNEVKDEVTSKGQVKIWKVGHAPHYKNILRESEYIKIISSTTIILILKIRSIR